MKKLLLPFLVFFATALHSQSRLDSLLPIVHTLPVDSIKVQTYLDIAWDLLRRDSEATFHYADSAENLSHELQLPSRLARAKRTKSFALSSMGRYKEAEAYLKAALDLFAEVDDQEMVVDTKVEIGWLKQTQSQFEEAMVYYMEALPLAEKLDNKNTEARIHSYMGGIYRVQKQHNQALDHYRTALDIVEQLGIKRGISACLTNLASTYNTMGNYDTAIAYHKKALILKKELKDDLGTGRVLNNIGVVYNNLKSYNEADKSFTEAYSYATKVNNPHLAAIIQYGMVSSAFGKGEFQRSVDLAVKLLASMDSVADLDLQVKVHQKLANAYGQLGDYQNAYKNASTGQALSDSLYNEKILEVTNDLDAKYQNEKNAREIALLATEKDLQALQLMKRVNERNVIIAFAILAIFLAGLLYNQYRIKQKLNEELKELNRLKSNFFANISHEFRTPLTLIKGPIEQWEQNPDEPLSRENVKMVRRNTNRVLGLVNQLLDLSKMDQGKMHLKPTEGDIYKCLRAAAVSFNSHAAQRNMDFKVDIPNSVLWTSFDRDKLEKVIFNLLSNAFKFSDDGETVSIYTSHNQDELNIQVGDSGKGIPEDKLPFIFDRFYQIDSSPTKEKEGSGIGLSLSKDLVELMDGTITVTSEEGKGTFFSVQLPIQKIETREKDPLEKLQDAYQSTVKPTPYHLSKTDKRNLPEILLVEDNADMRQFIKEHLISEFKIKEAWNGSEGLKKAKSEVPDLIISDLMMPKMDGIELCKKVKANVQTSHIPIVMLTAKAGMENKIEGLETGVDDYLTKPFDADELLARVKNLLDQRKKLRDLYSKKDAKLEPQKITANSMDQKFLEQVQVLLEKNHPNSDYGVYQLQKDLAMSKTQLHRKIKALTNETPSGLLKNFRLKRAEQLLSKKVDSVTQIAYQTGFKNPSYFAKCFRESYGVSPSSY